MAKKTSIIETIIRGVVTNFPLVSLALTIIFVIINYNRNKSLGLKHYIIKYTFMFMLGLTSLWAGISHLFLSKTAAGSIGWESNGFEKEIGFVNLGLALAGFMASSDNSTDGFRLATIIISSVFLLGAVGVHIQDAIKNNNFSVNNMGTILVHDLGTTLTLLITHFMK